MANPLRDLFFGPSSLGTAGRRGLYEATTPRRTFRDVVLPLSTVRALEYALVQIRKHDLLFRDWGLAERHSTGLGQAFNFAGPPGTGKTACAEALAQVLGRKLLSVQYAEMESMWAGETAKHVAAVFRAASEQNAVLFFDEADAIAGRRFTSVERGYEREANATVNVLLRELEQFDGVVIFATNLAANFDPAFERRIRTHILFEMPGPDEREAIWRVQLHERKTPLAPDVDFRALAERYEVAGGDIKNAVLKAAQMAVSEPGDDADKAIAQRHFALAAEDVLAAKRVMSQSLFDGDGSAPPGPWAAVLAEGQQAVEDNLSALAARVVTLEDTLDELPATLARLREEQAAGRYQLVEAQSQTEGRIGAALDRIESEVRGALAAAERRARIAIWTAALAVGAAGGALLVMLLR